MSGATVKMHGRSHRLGGSDPVPFEISEISGIKLSQSITTTVELEFTPGNVYTNDRKTYAWDPDDPGGLVVKRSGFYMAFAYTNVSQPDSATIRAISVRIGTVSGGPIAGTELGQYYLPGGGLDTSPNTVTATSESKRHLSEIAIGSFTVDPDNPARIGLVLTHTGTNYTVAKGTLRVMRIGGGGSTPPLPPGA